MKRLRLLCVLAAIDVACSVPPAQLPPGASAPICQMSAAPPRPDMYVQNDSAGARCGAGQDYATSSSIPVDDHCFCDDPAMLGFDAGVFDGWAQFGLSGHNACKPDSQLATWS